MPTFYLPTKLNTDYFYYRLNLIPIFTAAYDLVFPPDFCVLMIVSETSSHVDVPTGDETKANRKIDQKAPSMFLYSA